jgi:RHS repeat-associated protein
MFFPYYPVGDCRNSTQNLLTDKLFTGQRLDSTGLYFYNARYYNPEIGRFISPDTIVPDFSNPQSLNRYSYCLNNPLKYVDTSGHNPGYDYYTAMMSYSAANPNSQIPAFILIPLVAINAGYLVTLEKVASLSGKAAGSSWVILATDPRIKFTDRAIIDTTKKGGGRLFSIELDHNGGKGVHFNADKGPLSFINEVKLPKAALYAKWAARGTIILGLVVDTCSINSAIQADGGIYGQNTMQAVGQCAGGWAGALAGATIGTGICPVYGTFIGGILGGIFGGFVGGAE